MKMETNDGKKPCGCSKVRENFPPQAHNHIPSSQPAPSNEQAALSDDYNKGYNTAIVDFAELAKGLLFSLNERSEVEINDILKELEK